MSPLRFIQSLEHVRTRVHKVALRAALLGCTASLALPLVGTPAMAQAVSHEVVQPLPDPNKGKLDDALRRIARNRRDLGALIDAGTAASALGDHEAAKGFFKRANEISPNNPQVQAGLARATMYGGDPVAALALFEAADHGGIGTAQIAADWGLAYDLAGDNADAQRLYAQATNPADADTVRLRLAVSQAISGHPQDADKTLMPLLRRQDKPAWRTRAFVYAIGGDTKKAESTVAAILPPKLAEAVKPYMRYMPRLTRAQQSAAANLGEFPRAAQVGTDTPEIAAFAASHGGDSSVGGRQLADAGGVAGNAGAPSRDSARRKRKGRDSRGNDASRSAARLAQADRVAPGEVHPQTVSEQAGRDETGRDSQGELPAIDEAHARDDVMPGAPTPTPAPRGGAEQAYSGGRNEPSSGDTAMPAPNQRTPVPVARGGSASPGFTASDAANPVVSHPVVQPVPEARSTPGVMPAATTAAGGSTQAPEASTQAPRTSTPVVERPNLAQAFSDLGHPALGSAAPQHGAVDMRKLDAAPAPLADTPAPQPVIDTPAPKPVIKAPSKPAPKPKAAPKPAPQPARKWVQIGVGSQMNAVRWTWRQLVLKAPDAFRGLSPYTAQMGQTNRILVGPFDSDKDASDFMSALKADGVTDFVPWDSDAGEAVDALKAPSVDEISPPLTAAQRRAAQAKKAAAEQPARKWVQIGVGSRMKAVRWTWRQLVLKAPDAFRGQEPYTAQLGQTNRILVGPFDSDKDASDFMSALKADGVTDFVPWNSDAGEAVTPLNAPSADDIARSKPTKTQTRAQRRAEATKKKEEAQPARQWVQIGVGRDKKALAFTWQRLKKKVPRALRGQDPWVAALGRTNRMVVGPFDSDKAAQKFMDALRKEGIDNYVPWNSDEGEAVEKLPVD